MEDEWSSNATSTASRLMFVYVLSSHYLPPSPSPPQFARNHTQSPGREPLPYSEGCGLNQYHLRSLRSEDVVAAAPPLFKGMWAACCRSMKEWGTETCKREPKKWEAPQVRHNVYTASNSSVPLLIVIPQVTYLRFLYSTPPHRRLHLVSVQ